VTDATLAILATGIPATIAAIAGVINSFKANGIHRFVNSNLTQVKADLFIANERIASLMSAKDKGNA
jgi:hypothetical protein